MNVNKLVLKRVKKNFKAVLHFFKVIFLSSFCFDIYYLTGSSSSGGGVEGEQEVGEGQESELELEGINNQKGSEGGGGGARSSTDRERGSGNGSIRYNGITKSTSNSDIRRDSNISDESSNNNSYNSINSNKEDEINCKNEILKEERKDNDAEKKKRRNQYGKILNFQMMLIFLFMRGFSILHSCD